MEHSQTIMEYIESAEQRLKLKTRSFLKLNEWTVKSVTIVRTKKIPPRIKPRAKMFDGDKDDCRVNITKVPFNNEKTKSNESILPWEGKLNK